MTYRIPARSVAGDQIFKETTRSSEKIPHYIPDSGRVASAEGSVTTFRTIGAAALLHNLFSIENSAGSGVLVAVRRLNVMLDHTAALAAVAPTVQSSRPTALPTGGTVLGRVFTDTTQALSASVVCRGATASHGGAATAIAATAGASLWTQFTSRLHTAAGFVQIADNPVITQLSDDTPQILRPGEALLVQVVAAATTSNPNTNHWIVNCAFEEFTLPA